jgi:hypothetical protein
VLWIQIWIRNPDPDPGEQKLPTKIEKIQVFVQLYFLQFGHKNPGTEPVLVNLLRSLGIDSQPGVLVRQAYLTYRPASRARIFKLLRLLRPAESIPGLLKRLQIQALWSHLCSA